MCSVASMYLTTLLCLVCVAISTISTGSTSEEDLINIVRRLHQPVQRNYLQTVEKDSKRARDPAQIVETVHGPVVGERREEVDQRQDTLVSWTQFKVGP